MRNVMMLGCKVCVCVGYHGIMTDFTGQVYIQFFFAKNGLHVICPAFSSILACQSVLCPFDDSFCLLHLTLPSSFQ